MAVKTVFSDQELKQIIENYQLGQYIESRPFENGNVQTNIFILTSEGRFVFRLYENRTEQAVLFEIDLLNFLKEHQFLCPAPISNKIGEFVGNYDSKPYVLFEFVEGHHIDSPNEMQKQAIIQKAAELHLITNGYIPSNLDSRWNYHIEFCREQVQMAANRINTSNAKEKLIWYENQLENLILPASLPKGVCHADFHYSNMLFNGNDFAALLDFDDANYTYLLFDLVALIEHWAWPYKKLFLNIDKAKEIVQEYSKYRQLEEVEKKHLFDIYKMSILIDCIWYFERGNSEDFYERSKIEFLDGLGRGKFYQLIFG